MHAGNCRIVDEFELIRDCFRTRASRRPDTVLGIGDDAALLDTGGLPLAHASATAPLSGSDDADVAACRVFGTAFIRLAARAVTPRWATLSLTLETGGPDWIEGFAAATATACEACGVELIGGDTTRGPGRATVFALGTGSAPPCPTASQPPAVAVAVRLSFSMVSAEHAIADLVSVCSELAGRGADIRCNGTPATRDNSCALALEIIVRTDAAGMDAIHAVAGHRNLATRRFEANG